MPYSAEDYVHRIGRTGRAGANGRALSLVTAHDDKLLAEIAKLVRMEFELKTIRAEEERPARTERTERGERPNREARAPREPFNPERASTEARIRHIERSAPHRRSAWDEEELNYLRRKMAVSDDPFFSKPYEANADAHSPKMDLAHTHLSSTMPQPKAKKPVAALFAMGKKK